MAKAKKPPPKGLTDFAHRELRLELPRLEDLSPDLVWIHLEPETHEDGEGRPLTVLGSNMGGLLFVLAEDGSVHLVDDTERELGRKIFANVEAFAKELARQNP